MLSPRGMSGDVGISTCISIRVSSNTKAKDLVANRVLMEPVDISKKNREREPFGIAFRAQSQPDPLMLIQPS